LINNGEFRQRSERLETVRLVELEIFLLRQPLELIERPSGLEIVQIGKDIHRRRKGFKRITVEHARGIKIDGGHNVPLRHIHAPYDVKMYLTEVVVAFEISLHKLEVTPAAILRHIIVIASKLREAGRSHERADDLDRSPEWSLVIRLADEQHK